MQENYPQRKQIRLKYYDYSIPGYYFITICTHNKEHIFWNNDKENNNCRGGACSARTKLNNLGKIIENNLTEITNRYTNVELDEYVIMPNHIYAIIVLCENEKRAEQAPPLQ